MYAIKNLYLIISLVALMIIRIFAPGEWMGSIAIAGVLINLLDIMRQIWEENRNLISRKKKKKLVISFLIMSGCGIVPLIFGLVNLIVGIEWMNTSLCQDEITLFSLLICLTQKVIVQLINMKINE